MIQPENTHQSESLILDSPGTILQYPDVDGGYTEKVFAEDGTTFNMGALLNEVSGDPVAGEFTIVVEFENTKGGQTVREAAAIGYDGMVDPRRGRARAFAVNGVPVSGPGVNKPLEMSRLQDPQFDITIGKPWLSPMGTTGPVRAVGVPYTHRNIGDNESKPGKQPPTIAARTRLDEALHNPEAAARHAAERAAAKHESQGVTPDQRVALANALGAVGTAMNTIGNGRDTRGRR